MKRSVLLLFGALMALAAAAPAPVAAQILTVTDPGNEGPGTLRDLVAQAPSGATIELPFETVRLEREIAITKNLTIVGGRISGANLTRIFSIGVATVTLIRVSLADGTALVGDPVNPDGGAVFVAAGGRLVLDQVSLRNNRARNGGAIYCLGRLDASRAALGDGNTATDDGGALFVGSGAIATLDTVNIGRNVAGRGGGAIAVLGELNLFRSRVLQNTGRSGGGIGIAQNGVAHIVDTRFFDNTAIQGGAINNTVNGRVEINGGSFGSNTAVSADGVPGVGGVILSLGDASFVNSTMTENQATVAGGAVFVGRGASAVFPGTATLTNVTMFANTATTTPAGGNVANSQGSVTLTRSIVGNGGCTGGGIVSGGFNINAGNDCLAIGAGTGDKVNVGNLNLAPFGNWGGLTPSMPPLPGSPVIDAGGACTGTDQAGNARPQGGACDVGAREALPFASAGVDVNIPSNGVAFAPGDTLSVTFNFLPGTSPIPRDLYAGAAVPSGSDYIIVSVIPNPGGGFQVAAGPTLVPLATNTTLTQPLTIPVTHTWAPSNPVGRYFAGAITTPPTTDPLAPSLGRYAATLTFTLSTTTP